ncbi:MAG: hypothetical protein M3440_05410 [Chloroflexota bacterium]|nr:hypothetical protein [Chloroflexota bacterium]
MANTVSHRLTVATYLRIPFYAGAGITYDPANPTALHGRAVRISTDRTVVLAAAGERVDGSIFLVEPPDRMGVKVTVSVAGMVWFKMATGATFTGAGESVLGGADGVAPGGASVAARGIVTHVDTVAREVGVLLYPRA